MDLKRLIPLIVVALTLPFLTACGLTPIHQALVADKAAADTTTALVTIHTINADTAAKLIAGEIAVESGCRVWYAAVLAGTDPTAAQAQVQQGAAEILAELTSLQAHLPQAARRKVAALNLQVSTQGVRSMSVADIAEIVQLVAVLAPQLAQAAAALFNQAVVTDATIQADFTALDAAIKAAQAASTQATLRR